MVDRMSGRTEKARRRLVTRRDRMKRCVMNALLMTEVWRIASESEPFPDTIPQYLRPHLTMAEALPILARCDALKGAFRDVMHEAFGVWRSNVLSDSNTALLSQEQHVIDSAAIDAAPHWATHTDMAAVVTYVVYCRLRDYCWLTGEERPELLRLVETFGDLADWIVPENSRLSDWLHAVYYATRDQLQFWPEWPEQVWLLHPAYRDKPVEDLPYWLQADINHQRELLDAAL